MIPAFGRWIYCDTSAFC